MVLLHNGRQGGEADREHSDLTSECKNGIPFLLVLGHDPLEVVAEMCHMEIE